MKHLICTISLLLATTASAANLMWTTDFTSDYLDAGGNPGDGDPVGKLTFKLLDGETDGKMTLDLYGIYAVGNNFFPASWRETPTSVPWGVYTFKVGVEYDVPASLVNEGQEHLLGPNWVTESGWWYSFWARGVWGAPVEWTVPVEPPPVDPPVEPPVDPGDGSGGEGGDDGSPIPEPGTYALLFGLGLVGFATWRRYATR